MLIASTFWDFFFVMLIWVPLMVIWFGAIADAVTRPDLGGWAKAAWIVAIVLLPLIGTLIYVIARPRMPMITEAAFYPAGESAARSTASDLASLSQLHESGALTDAEYDAAKVRVLAE